MAELKYFNALMNSVIGNDQERKAAKEYLAEVDPEIWSESKEQGPHMCGLGRVVKNVIKITLDPGANSLKCQWPMVLFS